MKDALFLIIFLLLVGGKGFATTLFGTNHTMLKNNNKTIEYYIENRDVSLNPSPNSQTNLWFDTEYVGDGIATDFVQPDPNIPVANLENWTGYYLGTVTTTDQGGANETEDLIEALMSSFLTTTVTERTFDVTSWDKIETPGITEGDLNITYDVFKDGGTEPIAGTWSTSDDSIALDIYTVKSSNEFAMYYVLPSQVSGFWSSIHNLASDGNIASISHFTGGLGTVTSTEPLLPNLSGVPEPGTMILLGFGLISLAGIGRRKIKK